MSLLNLDEFFIINCAIFTFGLMNIGLSISIYSDSSNIYSDDVSTSFLHLGLLSCLPSIGALIFTILARKGIMLGKKLLLTPLMLFLKIVPILVASLTFISMVVQCQNLAILLNSENMDSSLVMMKVGMSCLLIFLYFMTFICWITYFGYATAFMMTKLEMVFFLNQNTSTNTRPGSDDPEFVPEQIVEMDADFPPTYEELFDKSMNEDDKSLPCYEVACETEAQTATASHDGNGTSFMGETVDDTSDENKT